MDNGIIEDGCVCDPPTPTCIPGSGANPCNGHPCIQCGPNGTTNSESVISAMTLYGELKNDGLPGTNFVLWAEGLFDVPNDINKDPFICQNADYVQKHNPAAFFTNSRKNECPPTVVWKGWAQGTMPPPPEQLLPTVNNVSKGVAFVIPGQDHNGHDGGGTDPTKTKVQRWNNWLRDNIGPNRSDMKSYVDYALHQGVYSTNTDKVLLIITQDEKSDRDYPCKTCPPMQCSANHIILFLIAADLTPQSDSALLDTAQYNILRTITKNFGLGNLGNAGTNVPALIPPIPPP
jgi:hypothetical protein